jgi:hypothetical protein
MSRPQSTDSTRRGAARRLWPAASALAAALALWVAARERASRDAVSRDQPVSGTRTRGASSVQLDWTIQRRGDVFQPRRGDTLQPGDALHFGVRTSRAGYAVVLSLDGERQSSVYREWVAVAEGERQVLPGAVVLDGVLGDEHLYGIVCDVTSALGPFQDAIRREPARPELPPGCAFDHHVVRRVGP